MDYVTCAVFSEVMLDCMSLSGSFCLVIFFLLCRFFSMEILRSVSLFSKLTTHCLFLLSFMFYSPDAQSCLLSTSFWCLHSFFFPSSVFPLRGQTWGFSYCIIKKESFRMRFLFFFLFCNCVFSFSLLMQHLHQKHCLSGGLNFFL